MRYVCSVCQGKQYQIWIDGEDGTVEKDDCVCKQLGLPPFVEVSEPRPTAKTAVIEFQREAPAESLSKQPEPGGQAPDKKEEQ